MVRHAGELRFEVIGRPLDRFATVRFPLPDLPPLPEPSDPIGALVSADAGLFARWPDRWRQLDQGNHRLWSEAVADVRPGNSAQPTRIAWRGHDGTIWTDHRIGRMSHFRAAVGGAYLSSPDGHAWTHSPWRFRFEVADPAELIGVARVRGRSLAITCAAGRISTHSADVARRPLELWDDVSWVSVHPQQPWLVVQRAGGEIEVADLDRRVVIQRVHG